MLVVPRLPLLMIAAVVLQPRAAADRLLVGARRLDGDGARRARGVRRAARAGLRGERASGRRRTRARAGAAPAAERRAGRRRVADARRRARHSARIALSFFGVGVRPPQASWGNMLYQAQTTISTEPWLALAPGMFILITTVAVNLAGDQLARRT